MRQVNSAPTTLTPNPRFDGTVHGVHISPPEDPLLHAFVVHFEPGGRTAWHAHEKGQLLICTDGRGTVGTRDGDTIALTPGTCVWTDAGEDHWHGASADASMTHVAVQTETQDAEAVTWKEPVTAVQR